MTDEISKELWVDRYRPTRLDEYVMNDDLKAYFRQMVKNRSIQNFTVEGCPGSGKTSLARLLAEEIGADVLFVKCATNGTIDYLRSTIEPFCNALSFEGRQKIVIMDEIDAASGTAGNGSGFQSGMRTLIESAQDDCRFICCCNYINKVIPAVLSRCPVIPLKYDKRDLLARIREILDREHVKYTKDSLKAFIEEAFGFYPDCRRIINYLQFCSSSGELVVKLGSAVNSTRRDLAMELLRRISSGENLLETRQFYMKNKDDIQDYVTFASDIFNQAVDSGALDADGILKLTGLIYQLNVVIDKEVGFFAIITALAKYGKKVS